MKVSQLGDFVFVTTVCGPTRISSVAVACMPCMENFEIDDLPQGEMPNPPASHSEVNYWYDWKENSTLLDVVQWAGEHNAKWHGAFRQPAGANSGSASDQPSDARVEG